ncbi:MAG: maleylpyruvate isomerase family mycothiol-dependent enzyme [Actinomycetes bacterium]
MNHDEWLDFADHEYVKLLQVLSALSPDAWDAPTDCAGWTVRDVVAHIAGAAASTASLRENLRQWRLSRRHEGDQLIDRINDVQLAERRDSSPSALISELSESAPRSVIKRRGTPHLMRRVRIPTDTPGLGWTTVGHLNDVVYTRDVWMHRVDICRATGHPLILTSGHDGQLIGDAADAWLVAPGSPKGLSLTGPAGGQFGSPDDETPAFDAIEFCRALSGRGHLNGVRADIVPF